MPCVGVVLLCWWYEISARNEASSFLAGVGMRGGMSKLDCLIKCRKVPL
jgi:hypothetical protein